VVLRPFAPACFVNLDRGPVHGYSAKPTGEPSMIWSRYSDSP
jgi:hypothetical protein